MQEATFPPFLKECARAVNIDFDSWYLIFFSGNTLSTLKGKKGAYLLTSSIYFWQCGHSATFFATYQIQVIPFSFGKPCKISASYLFQHFWPMILYLYVCIFSLKLFWNLFWVYSKSILGLFWTYSKPIYIHIFNFYPSSSLLGTLFRSCLAYFEKFIVNFIYQIPKIMQFLGKEALWIAIDLISHCALTMLLNALEEGWVVCPLTEGCWTFDTWKATRSSFKLKFLEFHPSLLSLRATKRTYHNAP